MKSTIGLAIFCSLILIGSTSSTQARDKKRKIFRNGTLLALKQEHWLRFHQAQTGFRYLYSPIHCLRTDGVLVPASPSEDPVRDDHLIWGAGGKCFGVPTCKLHVRTNYGVDGGPVEIPAGAISRVQDSGFYKGCEGGWFGEPHRCWDYAHIGFDASSPISSIVCRPGSETSRAGVLKAVELYFDIVP